MTDFRRASLLGALLLTASLVVACGGATATSVPPAAEPGTSAEASQSVAPQAASDAPPSDAAESVGALPTFDLDALTGGLPGVDSYRTETSIGGVKQYETVVVTKPVLSKAVTIFDESGGVSQRFVLIGDETWIADGADGEFVADTSGFGSTMLLAFDPALMLGGYAAVDWGTAASNQGVEEKNGVQAHHVRIDSTTFVGAAAAMPAGSAIDVWVADAGYLVAWEMSGFPDDANFSIQVTNVNDPANTVERPD